MLLIPAIDIKDGHCVRLRQGDLTSNITVFNTDPGQKRKAREPFRDPQDLQ